MPESQPFIQIQSLFERHPCPRCGWDMTSISIVPDRRGHAQRIFECARCGDETVLRG